MAKVIKLTATNLSTGVSVNSLPGQALPSLPITPGVDSVNIVATLDSGSSTVQFWQYNDQYATAAHISTVNVNSFTLQGSIQGTFSFAHQDFIVAGILSPTENGLGITLVPRPPTLLLSGTLQVTAKVALTLLTSGTLQVTTLALTPLTSGTLQVTTTTPAPLTSGTLQVTTTTPPPLTSGTLQVQVPALTIPTSGTLQVTTQAVSLFTSGTIQVKVPTEFVESSGTIQVTTTGAPPPFGIPPPPPINCTPPSGINALNPNDWLDYLRCVLEGAIQQLTSYLALIANAIGGLIWGALPSWIQVAFTSITNGLTAITTFLTTPATFTTGAITPLLDTSKTGPGNQFVEVYATIEKYQADIGYGIFSQTLGPYFAEVLRIIRNKYEGEIRGLLQATTLDSATLQKDMLALKSTIVSEVQSWAVSWEFVPFINLGAIAQIVDQVVDIIGLDGLNNNLSKAYLTAGALQRFQQEANAYHRATIPDIGTLGRLLARQRIDQTGFDGYAPKISGLTDSLITDTYKLQQETPGLADFIIWNRRHPDAHYDLTTLGPLTDTDQDRYAKIFAERGYQDIPIRTLKVIYQTGTISMADADFAIERQGFRKDVLPGQTKSDFEVMHDYVTQGLQGTLNTKLLASVERLYLLGDKTQADLQAAAATVYVDTTELQTYLDTAANLTQISRTQAKHFTYTQLIKFAETGIDISKFLTEDVAATGLDAAHQAATVDYIKKVLSGKGITV